MASWIVGLALWTTAVLKIFWGLDLIATEILIRGVKRPWLNGSFWLGLYFVTRSVVVDGYLGYALLNQPYEEAPFWISLFIILTSVEAGLAWYFLTRERREMTRKEKE